MNLVKYDPRSVYNRTNQTNKYVNYLDVWNPIEIPSSSSDTLIKLEAKYTHRPDLLAFDLYSSSQLWWVFIARNPDVLKDPIFDFKTGIVIYVPAKQNLGGYV